MKRDKRGGFWWWFLATLFTAGLLGWFLLSKMDRAPEDAPTAPSAEAKKAVVGPSTVSEKTVVPPVPQTERPTIALSEEERYRLVEKDLIDFLSYLDRAEYVRHVNPEKKALRLWQQILGRLTAAPPVPAGEGVDTRYLTANLYHFFRILTREDLRLLRAVLANEEETLEAHLDTLYRWLTLCPKCPSALSPRPPEGILYQYAGFFLNTIGGRGYLFRRSPEVRILVSYYALLILFDADRKGLNNYGVDVFPLIDPLMREMAHYPELRFSQQYLSRLKEIHQHYLKRRH